MHFWYSVYVTWYNFPKEFIQKWIGKILTFIIFNVVFPWKQDWIESRLDWKTARQQTKSGTSPWEPAKFPWMFWFHNHKVVNQKSWRKKLNNSVEDLAFNRLLQCLLTTIFFIGLVVSYMSFDLSSFSRKLLSISVFFIIFFFVFFPLNLSFLVSWTCHPPLSAHLYWKQPSVIWLFEKRDCIDRTGLLNHLCKHNLFADHFVLIFQIIKPLIVSKSCSTQLRHIFWERRQMHVSESLIIVYIFKISFSEAFFQKASSDWKWILSMWIILSNSWEMFQLLRFHFTRKSCLEMDSFDDFLIRKSGEK